MVKYVLAALALKERGDLFVALCKKYGAVRAQAQAFELGTGWMRWYSLPAESPKNYLRFSDRAWSCCSRTTYNISTGSRPARIDRIGSAGFVLLERIAETADVGGLPIAPVFRHYRQEDLACTILTLVYQKPH